METGIHELTAGYALDALDPEERAAYEAHLDECERCREELAALLSVTDALAVGASGPDPSPELRGRIVAQARAEPQVIVPFEPRRKRRIPVLAVTAGAVAAIALVAVGAWSVHLANQRDDARAALAQLASIVGNPGSQSVSLATGDGRLVVSPEGNAVLVLTGLAPAPSGKTYEAWVIRNGKAAPAGLFPGEKGTNVVGVDGTVTSGDVVAVTVEKAGGATAPTQQPIVASNQV